MLLECASFLGRIAAEPRSYFGRFSRRRGFVLPQAKPASPLFIVIAGSLEHCTKLLNAMGATVRRHLEDRVLVQHTGSSTNLYRTWNLRLNACSADI